MGWLTARRRGRRGACCCSPRPDLEAAGAGLIGAAALLSDPAAVGPGNRDRARRRVNANRFLMPRCICVAVCVRRDFGAPAAILLWSC